MLLSLLLFTSVVDKIYAKNANFMQHMSYLCIHGMPMWLVDAKSRHIERCTASQMRHKRIGMSESDTYTNANVDAA